MKTTITLIGLIALCLSQSFGQVDADKIDWSTYTNGSIGGLSDQGAPWVGDYDDQDGSGLFGVNNGVFTIEDTEGLDSCPCDDAGTDTSCGSNDNSLTIGPVLLSGYCEVNVQFEITTRGTLKCGAANDQSPQDVEVNACGGDSGNEWLETDALEITLINTVTGEQRTTKICGDQTTNGSLIIDETFDFTSSSAALTILITGGTQNGGAYDIGNVTFTGRERINDDLNLRVVSNNNNTTICEGEGEITLSTSADPTSNFVWVYPNGTTVAGDINNGRHELNLTNIGPAQSGTYEVIVTDANLCELREQIALTILSSDHANCRQTVEFANLFGTVEDPLCSNIVLPDTDDNGIKGVWTPSPDLSLYAGQTVTLTFTPDDPSIAPDSFTFPVQDLQALADIGSIPDTIPIFCNASNQTYDLLEIFGIEMDPDIHFTIQGDADIFDFNVPLTQSDYNDRFEEKYRNFSVFGKRPREESGFVLEALARCPSSEPVTKSFFIHIIDDVQPIVIDTAICEGDYVEFGHFKIYRDTTIVAPTECDTSLMAKIRYLEPARGPLVSVSAACGRAIYYYDKLDENGDHIGFQRGSIESPPYGFDYDTVFIKEAGVVIDVSYTLPMPAANGCDSVQQVAITGGGSSTNLIEFDLCSNRDTFVFVGADRAYINRSNPRDTIISSTQACTYYFIHANIIPSEEMIIPPTTHCAGDIVPIEVAPGDVRDFDETYTYPHTVSLAAGPNGCPATAIVDLTFIQPRRGTEYVRLCPGDQYTLGGRTFSAPVTDEEVVLVGQASTNCDSIVALTVEFVEPESRSVSEVICEESSHIVEGETFDFSRPNGVVSIPSSLGCDSIVINVSTSFFEVNDVVIDTSLCPGDEILLPEYGYTITDALLTDDFIHLTNDGCQQNILIRARLKEPVRTTFSKTICAGSSYFYDGQDRFDSGQYEERHVAASGCDSISVLDLTVLPAIPVTTIGPFTTCPKKPVVLFGNPYDTEGTFSVRLTTNDQYACDSIVTFAVIFDPIPESDAGVQMTCPGTPLPFLGKTWDEEGAFSDTISTVDGCDSIVNFEVMFYPDYDITLDDQITCPEQPFMFDGVAYDAGTHTVELRTIYGCDSITTFTVIHEAGPLTDVERTVCFGDGELVNNVYYDATIDTMIVIAGGASDGCDSTVHLNLTVRPQEVTPVTMDLCRGQSEMIAGVEFTEAVVDQQISIPNRFGCDSIVSVTINMIEPAMNDLGVPDLCGVTSYTIGDSVITESGIHTVTLAGAAANTCDSIVTIDARFYPVYNITLDDQITCPEQPFMFDGVAYDAGTHTVELRTIYGCDSITTFTVIHEAGPLTDVERTVCFGDGELVNNVYYDATIDTMIVIAGGASDGCDSTVHLNLTVRPQEVTLVTRDLCRGQSEMIAGVEFTEAVVDQQISIPNRFNCDSIVSVTINMIEPSSTDLGPQVSCGTNGFTIGDTTLTDAGAHTVTLIGEAANGCDSIVMVDLTVISAYTRDIDTTICFGQVYDFYGSPFSTSTSTSTTFSAGDCDSTINLNLTVLPEIPVTDLGVQPVCHGGEFMHDGVSYAQSGVESIVYPSQSGCDSIVTFEVLMLQEVSSNVDEVTCANEPYEINGQTFTTTGLHQVTFNRPGECDSTVYLNLTVHPAYDIDLGPRQICINGAYPVGDTLLTQAGQHTIRLDAEYGCDSIVRLTLEVQDVIREDLGVVVLCPGESYPFAGRMESAPGMYADTSTAVSDCDSITTLEIRLSEAQAVIIDDVIGSCEGGANGSFTIREWPGALPSFILSDDSESLEVAALPITIKALSEGSYSYELRDANGCMETFTVNINADRNQALEITQVLVDGTGGRYQLDLDFAGTIAEIYWEQVDGLSCYDCPDPVATVTETTTFEVTVVDEDGCVSMASITLEAELSNLVYIPNIINTNSSNYNHRFRPDIQDLGTGDIFYDMHIYDRWGGLMYKEEMASSLDNSTGWNGRLNGVRINQGVYVYLVRVYNTEGLSKVYAGDVTVTD